MAYRKDWLIGRFPGSVPKILSWECMTGAGLAILVPIEARFNAAKYVKICIKEDAILKNSLDATEYLNFLTESTTSQELRILPQMTQNPITNHNSRLKYREKNFRHTGINMKSLY